MCLSLKLWYLFNEALSYLNIKLGVVLFRAFLVVALEKCSTPDRRNVPMLVSLSCSSAFITFKLGILSACISGLAREGQSQAGSAHCCKP